MVDVESVASEERMVVQMTISISTAVVVFLVSLRSLSEWGIRGLVLRTHNLFSQTVNIVNIAI